MLAAVSLTNVSSGECHNRAAHTAHRKTRGQSLYQHRAQERRAIERVLRHELGRATADHLKLAHFVVTSLKTDSGWALAEVKPVTQTLLDPMTVLLHKVQGRWKYLVLGSSLHGVGKTFHVPSRLRQKWNL